MGYKVSLQWRGETLSLEYDRLNWTVGDLVDRIREMTSVPPERMLFMVPGWTLKKPTNRSLPLSECTTDVPEAKGIMMGTPTGQEFISGGQIAVVEQTVVKPAEDLVKGYTNMGNTCYLNSVLAMLENCDGFRNFIIQDTAQPSSPLQQAWQRLWANKGRNVASGPNGLFQLLTSIYPPFAARSPSNPLSNQQQDADECLTVLFNNIRDTTNWKNLFQINYHRE
ncbi:ubiquitin carboxyl-terminal hydrolase [Gregarina niphandrodes]|uniref:ubiquitinyl hydrolase 1 n=1 Tax=Gregarina niphandrodes TaxID=110365 RepID=A0A023B590_GRENI|nr:ubiquitin carboxyl-terminal hydrolase [Gregarina niphandrodes]EZG59148.1 ubiquitin carboxyl-terminal hydrolase [Gregarina niphandrodes]|eukprot:XP_011130908.1 ubiquitin carboxyl-terminal hydrolase [Gregarina niphandrodes]